MAGHDFYISTKEIGNTTKDCLRGSWGFLAKASLLMCLICLVPILAAVLLAIFVKWWIAIPVGILCLYVFAIMRFGFANICLKLAKQERPYMGNLFAGFSKNIKSILSITTKKIFLSLFWLIVFVFPFFIKNIGYSMSTLLVIDREDIDGSNALVESMHIMKQNYMRYFKLLLSNIGWYLLIILSAGIGYVWINAILATKKALFYENLKTEF